MNEKENNINIKINNFTDDFNNKLKDKIDSDKIKEINDCINIKYNELKELINKCLDSEYIQKINYKFKKEPKNLKYKLDITNIILIMDGMIGLKYLFLIKIIKNILFLLIIIII